MLGLDRFRSEIEGHIGPIQHIVSIEKGFSFDSKFKVETAQRIYLARLSTFDTRDVKAREFTLIQQLYKAGVHCNEPIAFLQDEAMGSVCVIYSYLAGVDAEENITKLPPPVQYQIGIAAGEDLKQINGLSGTTNTWKVRKWQKHENYVMRYFQQDFRFKADRQVLQFIETHYDPTEATCDTLQHDDFHLGNIILTGESYGGVIDFNRYDWGDPLHEFIKLEWFTWPVSEAFARGQVMGYFGRQVLDDATCSRIAVYIAMSIFSTLVWTLEFHPHTWPEAEKQMTMILNRYKNFEETRPLWANAR